MERLWVTMPYHGISGIGALVITVVVSLSSVAEAEQAWVDARQHFDRGTELEETGDLIGALSEFERAMELRPTFRLHRHMGRVCRGLGRLLDAREHYEAYLSEGGDRIEQEHRESVDRALAELEGLVARIFVEAMNGATVLIDGQEIATTPMEEPYSVDPGDHSLEVRLLGHRSIRREVALETGQELHLQLELIEGEDAEEDDESSVATPLEDETPSSGDQFTTPTNERRRPIHRGIFYGALGLSLAAFATCAVFGGLALGEQETFESLDIENRSQEQETRLQSSREQGQTWTRLSDAFLFSGAALAVATLVMAFFTDFSPSNEAGSLSLSPAWGRGSAGVMIQGGF